MDHKYVHISIIYLFRHLTRRISDFFYHWYVDGFLRGMHMFLGFLEELDKFVALRITAKNWFKPLYQDYSIIGYLWGFIFRTIRILIGLAIYLFLFFVSIGIFILWAFIPVYVIYQIFINL